MTLVNIDTRRIFDRASFHDLFSETFGFPGWYGRNMNAWIDLMSCLNAERDGNPSSLRVPKGQAVMLRLDYIDDFAVRCPDLYTDIVECAAFVNGCLAEKSLPPVIALAFYKR